MTALEEDFPETIIKKPWLWWRYIVDISVIRQHGEDELKIFLEKINNSDPSIKFSCEYSLETVKQIIIRKC